MSKELKYIDELDYVLHFLATNPYAKGFISDGEMWDHIQKTEMRMEGSKLVMYLNKLVKDNYVHIEIPNVKESTANYKISFEGLIQDELGGYHQLYLKDIESRTIQNKLKNIQKWQLILTIILAFGALVASIYYGLEIINILSK